MALNFHGNGISAKFQKPVFIHTMSTSEKSSFSISVFSWVRTVRPKLGVFFQIYEIQHSFLLYYSAHKKATTMVFIWGDRGYPAVRFEYKTASEWYLVAEL